MKRGEAKPTLDAHGRTWWEQGWTDTQIAKKIGCSKSLVCRWRRLNGCQPANAISGSEDWLACQNHERTRSPILLLHEVGLTDTEIAAQLGITLGAAWARRKRMGLPRNRK